MRNHRRVGVAVALITVLASACAEDTNGEADADATTTTITRAPVVLPVSTVVETEVGATTLTCGGSGEIPVVLLAGGSDPSSTWDDLAARLGDEATVCRVDFASSGTGITPSGRADAVAAVLTAAGAQRQSVLVGHSLAGLTVREFGALHPDRVAGAVFLDPSTATSLPSIGPDLATQGWDVAATEAEVGASVEWPDVPVVVLSRDPALGSLGDPALEYLWSEGQTAYAALSPLGRQQPIAGSGHYVYRDAPEAVVAAIHEVTGDG